MRIETAFSKALGIEIPLICGAMYPCSNPELVAAASEAGGIGIVQPMALTFAHGYPLREGLRHIVSLTQKPIGFNAIVEKSVRAYEERMRKWVDIALEEGIRFFVTALGNPSWVVRKVEQVGGTVYHDVTERKWAIKAKDAGVHGLICVNANAGGHAGTQSLEQLYEALADLGLPLICAGGLGNGQAFTKALSVGYAGVQMGTRFIATRECTAHQDYKSAIINASANDIILTDKISGVPCSVIRTPYIEKTGTKANPFAQRLLKGRYSKKAMRTFYSLLSIWQLKKASKKGTSYKDFWAAGKSVSAVHEEIAVAAIFKEVCEAYEAAQNLIISTAT